MIKQKYASKIVGNWLKNGSLRDWSGNGHPATLSSGSTVFANTERGRVPAIDGAATEITVATNDIFDVAGDDFSISAWVYTRTSSGFQSIFDRHSANNGWRLAVNAGNFQFGIGDGATVSISDTAVLNRWIHLVGTYHYDATEGNTLASLYVNGVSVGTPAANNFVDNSSNPIGLGVENNGGTQWVDGYVQDAIIWKGLEFTAEEVSQLYEESLQEGHYDAPDVKHLDNTYDTFDATGDDILGVYIADGKGWNESVGNESAGFLSNTDWELNGVNTQIVSSEKLDGKKEIKAIAGGIQGSRPSNQAYGTWECKMNRNSTNFCTLSIIHPTKHGGFNVSGAYNISYRDNGNILLRYNSSAIVSDTTERAVDVEVAIKVTRTPAGLWELFVDGVSKGTGTEATGTTSAWNALEADAGNTIKDFRFLPYIE